MRSGPLTARWRAASRIEAAAGWVAVAALLVAVAVTTTAPAGADGIYRCTGADGKIVFTSSPGACPNARPHVLTGRVQTVVEGRSSASATRGVRRPAGPAARAGAGADGLERMWRRKRSESEQQLRQLERHVSQAQRMAKSCNRGGEWFRQDEAGIRQHVSCDEVKARLRKLEKQRSELQAYLRSGLEEECRRAGCLPGWIR